MNVALYQADEADVFLIQMIDVIQVDKWGSSKTCFFLQSRAIYPAILYSVRMHLYQKQLYFQANNRRPKSDRQTRFIAYNSL